MNEEECLNHTQKRSPIPGEEMGFLALLTLLGRRRLLTVNNH